MAESLDVLRGLLAALDARDLDAVRALLHDDVVLTTPNGRREGIDDVLGWVIPFQSAFVDIVHSVTVTTEEGGRAVAEMIARLSHVGTWTAPDGRVIPATGRRIANPAVDIVDVEAGKVRDWRIYFDELGMIEQLTQPAWSGEIVPVDR